MKQRLAKISAALLLSGIALQAHAYDGTITFNGHVSSTTCTASVNGGAASSSVSMPSVSANSLSAANATAGLTLFSITLSNCTSSSGGLASSAAAWFEPSTDVNAAGRLKNTAANNPAANVEVALYNTNSTTPIVVGQSGNNGASFLITNGAATLNYEAKYYATAAASAGDVLAKVNYTIQYQ